MSIQDDDDAARSTLGALSNTLKSGVADTSAIASDGVKKAEEAMGNEAKAFKKGVADAATTATGTVGAAAAAAKSEAVAASKKMTKVVATEASGLSGAIDDFAHDALGQFKSSVAEYPIRSVHIAAAAGYFAGLIARTPRR